VVVFIDHDTAGGEPCGSAARRRLQQGGYRCHAVLDIGRITRELHRAGRLTDAQAALLGQGGASGRKAAPDATPDATPDAVVLAGS
jgi:uridine monophosphate synthetase